MADLQSPSLNAYYDENIRRRELDAGKHRDFVGGMWEELGKLQFKYLVNRGLRPEHRLLDIGCGCFRGGVHFVEFLNKAHYYGVDISQELIDIGLEKEIGGKGLRNKLPVENVLCDQYFRFYRLQSTFDLALAQSVFTHLPWNHWRLCMYEAARVMPVNAVLYATVFTCTDIGSWSKEHRHERGGITTRPVEDPFHYLESDIMAVTCGLPWKLVDIEDWGHPRDQKMAIFRRVAEPVS